MYIGLSTDTLAGRNSCYVIVVIVVIDSSSVLPYCLATYVLDIVANNLASTGVKPSGKMGLQEMRTLLPIHSFTLLLSRRSLNKIHLTRRRHRRPPGHASRDGGWMENSSS